jgi:hypothetical protein
MYTDDKSVTAPVRRRIIQQPLRTEAAYALIAADPAQTGELEARLKRDRPLITFPSISHFLAEPVRREPWAAVVVARAGAWDPRFDSHVRRRRAIALFALPEEVYSWPEAVARVRDLTELSAWLESLDAPEPAAVKRVIKREQRARAKAALGDLGVRRLPQPARTVEVRGSARERDVEARGSAREQNVDAPDAPGRASPPAAPASAVEPKEVTLPAPVARARAKANARTHSLQVRPASAKGDRSLARASERVQAKSQSSAVGKKRGPPLQAPKLAGIWSSPSSQAADREFMRLAAELGLVRARELLAELRARTTRLARGTTRDRTSAR